MKRHIQDFNRFSMNENEAAKDETFVVGYMIVGEEGEESRGRSRYKNFGAAKKKLIDLLEGNLRSEVASGRKDFDTFFFLVRQHPEGKRVNFDPLGGSWGEILLDGSYDEIFIFNEYEPTEEMLDAAIQKVTSL